MTRQTWLAADYHCPITYSCKMPMSNPFSAQALPAPGPTTIRLTLIRKAIEFYGLEQTRNTLFPVIRKAELYIQPPASVAISSHRLRMYKANAKHELSSSLGYREFAHTYDKLRIFMKVPFQMRDTFSELFFSIGYWGQASTFATCLHVLMDEPPQLSSVIFPIQRCSEVVRGENYFTAFLSDWVTHETNWDSLMFVANQKKNLDVHPTLYVFPLEICERRSNGHRLVYRSLEVNLESGRFSGSKKDI